MYTELVMDHAMNPRNIGTIDGAQSIIKVGDPKCGDSLLLFLKFGNGVINDAKFMIKGCPAAIATSSMTTEMVKGMTLEKALELTDQQVADALGGLPEEKIHCSSLAVGAVHAGIKNFMASGDGNNQEP
ncbi:NifU-like domain protein [Syntrophotalea carbinolica DSM 2380]|uniref:NifU-like domain protein n=1 Tax=Syntrophotalea carbinolica (strain DSM 2380 / NBRC 103641 / GraBd1) TaxID=338963 RepID=Q3A1S5_SYNC1|nr:iron-sulfur cluster assembly scaffold protein [Syntrophotalea carbinolica]ABA89682.1 NifU-like domain protein [Syntrophotalea carbinolica DSM 2380]